MQCPICKKDLEIKNKKIGENEAGEAIYNEFAICRDCKKQWNLDKQREKKKSLQKKHWLKKQLKPVRLQKSHTKSARLPKEKTSAERPAQPKKKKNVRYLRKTPKSGPLLLLIQKYRLIRRKNVRTRLPKAKDR
ncbi:MAG: hypothetical protein ACLR2O_10945 [Coprococcus sp.]